MKIILLLVIGLGLSLLTTFITPSTSGATDEVPVFTDADLKQYRSSPDSSVSDPISPDRQKEDRRPSPAERSLRERKEQVSADNRDYIEEQYRWMKADCQKFESDMKKDCLFRSTAWYKEELRKLEELKKYLSK